MPPFDGVCDRVHLWKSCPGSGTRPVAASDCGNAFKQMELSLPGFCYIAYAELVHHSLAYQCTARLAEILDTSNRQQITDLLYQSLGES